MIDSNSIEVYVEPKKIYSTPKLETYGSVRELTQVKGGTKNDGGGAAASTRV